MYKKKIIKPKSYVRRLKLECPRCDKKLAVWANHSDGKEFIGCSTFPKCKYTRTKNEVDFIREQLEVPVDWMLDIDKDLTGIFSQCQSSKEKLYLLGAIYYLETNDFVYESINYKETRYYGLVFNRIYQYLKMGGYYPDSLAIVSQVEFGNNFHHDFGIFFSTENFPTENQWEFGLAVEIDYHPKHLWSPHIDEYRDKLVNYKVLRLREGDDSKRWFQKVELAYNSLFND